MSIGSDRNAIDLLAQAAAWRIASLLLECPRPGWRDEIEKIASEITDRELTACIADVDDSTEGAYHRLFGPGGELSPREVSYCGFEDPGCVMADLCSFYGGFSFRSRTGEPIDHISVETSFVAYLFLKEAYARAQGNHDAAAIARNARDHFMEKHVGRCADGMQNRMSGSTNSLLKVLSWIVKMASSNDSKVLAARGNRGF